MTTASYANNQVTFTSSGSVVYLFQFDNSGAALGNGICGITSPRAISLSPGSYSLVVADGSGLTCSSPDQAFINTFCGAGKTLSDCNSYFMFETSNDFAALVPVTISAPTIQTTAMFSVPTSTATSLTANVTSQLADPGFLAVLVIAVSIPLAFYVAHRLIGLVRGRAKA